MRNAKRPFPTFLLFLVGAITLCCSCCMYSALLNESWKDEARNHLARLFPEPRKAVNVDELEGGSVVEQFEREIEGAASSLGDADKTQSFLKEASRRFANTGTQPGLNKPEADSVEGQSEFLQLVGTYLATTGFLDQLSAAEVFSRHNWLVEGRNWPRISPVISKRQDYALAIFAASVTESGVEAAAKVERLERLFKLIGLLRAVPLPRFQSRLNTQIELALPTLLDAIKRHINSDSYQAEEFQKSLQFLRPQSIKTISDHIEFARLLVVYGVPGTTEFRPRIKRFKHRSGEINKQFESIEGQLSADLEVFYKVLLTKKDLRQLLVVTETQLYLLAKISLVIIYANWLDRLRESNLEKPIQFEELVNDLKFERHVQFAIRRHIGFDENTGKLLLKKPKLLDKNGQGQVFEFSIRN